MAPTRSRRLVTLLAVVTLLVALAGAAQRGGPERLAVPASPAGSYAFTSSPRVTLGVDTKARTAITWRGGPITASTGEVVRVFVSASLPVETTSPEAWAEFLAGLAHGTELSLLSAYIAPLAEVQEMCGAQALGCYGRDEMIVPSEPASDGTTPEEVVRHEYGHHVAAHRLNPPWSAIDWGPKAWASAANVCAKTGRSEAFPGDGGQNYSRNPGEAWAEVYRLMDERRAGIDVGRWPIISPSFYPDERALAAAERDVLTPWSTGQVRSLQRMFRPRTKVWWIPVSTPLDGMLRLTVALPRGVTHDVALVAPNRRTVLARGQWAGQRSKSLTTTVCGQRKLFVRVTQQLATSGSGALRRAPGLVRVSITTP